MQELTEDAIRQIEEIHSQWIACEMDGQDQNLMSLCTEDIEFWPPNAAPLIGRADVAAQIAHHATKIHRIEINERRIRGSGEVAYLTARYKTTFSMNGDSISRQVTGSHLWILHRLTGRWMVSLVSWSEW